MLISMSYSSERLREWVKPEILELKNKGYDGLVIIADGLDKIGSQKHPKADCSIGEYIFVNRAAQLRSINCHPNVLPVMALGLPRACLR